MNGMAYQRTFGPAIDPVTRLGWGLGIVALSVVVIVAVLLLGGIFRRRAALTGAASRSLAVRSDSGGVSWIYIGTGISSIVLVFCMVWTMVVTAAVSRPPGPDALTVQVTASQWWWSVRYLSPNPARIFTTANEIHIPTGQPIRLELMSSDVIHSFWIPQLAGKMDMIPGQTNVSWLQADRTGVYRGQCAAFCGAQHARMALLLVADSARDFAAWQDHQLEETPEAANASAGQQVFQQHCAICHTIRGLSPSGVAGPDLTHLMTRRTLASGLLPNRTADLAAWIVNPQALKPGARMPAQLLTGDELSAVTQWLNQLN
jgi:cytochrome c oxidase subunit 2